MPGNNLFQPHDPRDLRGKKPQALTDRPEREETLRKYSRRKTCGSVILSLREHDLIIQLQMIRRGKPSPSGILLITSSCLNYIKWPVFN